ncbi:MAG: proliferating cell nuclear antigen (pcna) [Nitrososphaeria archaeon]|jgi:proliferating cell nuclear antigen
MFVARSETPEEWKAIAVAISKIVEEATFEATSQGLNFRGMDPSHIALIDLNWPNSAFEKYECSQPLKIGLKIEDFVKLIKRASSNDKVELETKDNSLMIKFVNSYKKEYLVHLIEPYSSSTPLPKISLNSKAVIRTKALGNLLDDVQVVSETVNISAKKDQIILEGQGDTGNAKILLDKTNEDIISVDVKEESTSTYSLPHLLDIIGSLSSVSENVSLEFSTKMPIKLLFKIGAYGIDLCYYLAPRIE